MSALEIQQLHAAISERDHEIATLREQVRVLREAMKDIASTYGTADEEREWPGPILGMRACARQALAATKEADDAT